ncbi:T9SS type A sorting domain-containing protein [Hymenobacter sp. 15J16-1T3B]|uniref:T9SS type A sorting domain-containing protein n=1 Tax=Hymenobacter sp. 15J16-1T3B TaxID=2886941 RepID=UPI001D121AF9|nr:T9SS type A sorting domain-containing protein [Hymenobacter sp. 15J16-1T3B]MCC3160728.1 T9SS type A sorting domain-containing protein [Hymenobacter sp. 15J16-1T3B]
MMHCFPRLAPVFLGATLLLTAPALAQTTATVLTGTPTSLASTNGGPIYRSSASSTYLASQFAYVFDGPELSVAGLRDGDVITDVAWEKTTSGTSSRPATFRILVKNSTLATYTADASFAALTAGTTEAYSNANYLVPATIGLVNFPLTTPVPYTGQSLEVFTDWNMSPTGTGSPSTGSFLWVQYLVPDKILGFAATAPFTTNLSPTSNGPSSLNDIRPKTTFTYTRVNGTKNRVLLSGGAYPNPTTGLLHLPLHPAFAGHVAAATVLDATGRVLRQTSLSSAGTLDLGQLPAGVYLVRVALGDLTEVHRVTLQ